MKTPITTLILTLALSGLCLAQCGGCPSKSTAKDDSKVEKKAETTLSAEVASIKEQAGKGCATSAAKVAVMADWCKTSCGGTCSPEGCSGGGCADKVAKQVAFLESCADKGCADSAAKLASFKAKLDAVDAPLSERYTTLVANAENGCEKSAAQLASFQKSCGTTCNKTIAAKISTAEAACEQGCTTSAGKLASMRKSFDETCVVNASVAAPATKSGCQTTCGGSGSTAGADSSASKTLADQVSFLEASAAKGCEKSQAKLDAIKEILASEEQSASRK